MTVKVKIDEDLSSDVAEVFTAHGDDVHTVCEEELHGASDDEIWRICKAEYPEKQL